MSAVRQKRIGLKRNFGWALAGNLTYQATQWLNLVVLAKFLTPVDVGRFALALAITTPVAVFSSLGLRSVQVTDTREQHPFGHFLAVQFSTAALGFLALAAVCYWGAYPQTTSWLILTVGIGQAAVLIDDVFLAHLQREERMDIVARSRMIIGLTSLAALAVSVWSTRNLLVGVASLQLSKVAVLVCWDLPITARLVRRNKGQSPYSYLRPRWDVGAMVRLAWIALPLGFSSVLVALTTNVPRYFIGAYMGEGQLGYFAAVLALVMAGMTVTQAAGLSALPRLSLNYVEDRKQYIVLLGKLLITGGLLGALGLTVVTLIGKPLLRVFFAPEYAAFSGLLTWSMAFGALAYVVTFMGFGMTAMRRFQVQPLVYSLSLATTVIAASLLVPRYGLEGGVWSLIAGKACQGIASLIFIWRGLVSPAPPRKPTGSDPSGSPLEATP